MVLKLIYNLIFIPFFYIILILMIPFNLKIRKGFIGRFGSIRRLKKFKKTVQGRPLAVFHCASMGEFEHTKPFLFELKKAVPEVKTIVLFFSPSGFENIKSFSVVDLFIYSPHEFFFSVWWFIRTVQPVVWIIAKHDVWPNQVWILQHFKVPLFLINASLHRQSSRLVWFTRPFHREVYRCFTKILTVSVTDKNNFSLLVDQEKLVVVGDTKFDQVLFRKEESLKKQIIPPSVFASCWPLVAGSTWPDDHHHLIPAFIELYNKYPEMCFVICPHEPTEIHLTELELALEKAGSIRLSNIDSHKNERFILIDRIGVLANIYSIGKIAYVGGSFRQNVHNVVEPAAYQIPVLFGPVNLNSYEAQLLKAKNGGWEIRNREEIRTMIEKFYINDIYRQESGKKAFQVVEENCGATTRSIQLIIEYNVNKS